MGYMSPFVLLLTATPYLEPPLLQIRQFFFSFFFSRALKHMQLLIYGPCIPNCYRGWHICKLIIFSYYASFADTNSV